jgi:hypothetical protein
VDEGGNVHPADVTFGLACEVKRLQEAGVAGIVRDVELSNDKGGCGVNAAVVAELRRLPTLKSLRLDDRVEFDVQMLADLTQLTDLDLVACFTLGDCAALPSLLARLPSLREVVMRQPGPDVPAAVRDAFEGITGLTHLSATLRSW